MPRAAKFILIAVLFVATFYAPTLKLGQNLKLWQNQDSSHVEKSDLEQGVVTSEAPNNAIDSKKTIGQNIVPSLKSIQECLAKTGEIGNCLDKLFGDFFDKGGTTAEALAAARKYENEDTNFRYSCHPVMHAIGRETFQRHPNVSDSFQLCDQTCHSGCYHGAMERFLRGDMAASDEAGHISEDELKAKTVSACDTNQPTRFRFQCLHGLGHALVFFLDYKLERALGTCDLLQDQWSRSSCYGGAFMENVFSATPQKRDLSATDYHYPCSKLASKYKSDCYVMQTTRMTEMGLSTERLFEECKKAGLPAEPGEYKLQCMQSIGRDFSNDARVREPEFTSKRCEMVSGEDRNACIRGVIYALMDNTWDGKYAFPFCNSFSGQEDTSYCFKNSANYLKNVLARSNNDLRADCKKYSPSPETCYSLAGI